MSKLHKRHARIKKEQNGNSTSSFPIKRVSDRFPEPMRVTVPVQIANHKRDEKRQRIDKMRWVTIVSSVPLFGPPFGSNTLRSHINVHYGTPSLPF